MCMELSEAYRSEWRRDRRKREDWREKSMRRNKKSEWILGYKTEKKRPKWKRDERVSEWQRDTAPQFLVSIPPSQISIPSIFKIEHCR